MSSALKLRGAGLTPHFHTERSSNGSCGGPPPASAELARQVEKSTPAAHEPTPLGASVCLSWAFCARPRRTLSRLPAAGSDVSLHCSAQRGGVRAVEAAVSASLPFSLSTSLSTHSVGHETLFSFEQRSLGNITDGYVSWVCICAGPCLWVPFGLRFTPSRVACAQQAAGVAMVISTSFPSFPSTLLLAFLCSIPGRAQWEIGEVSIFTHSVRQHRAQS